MAVNFPNNPILNQTFSQGAITWRWNGYAWNRIPDPGAKGDIGQKGEQGGQGLTGDPGVKGDKGFKGNKGDVEEKGNKGEKGEKGTKGEKGQKGIKGEKGFKGDKGEKGQKGIKGEKGTKGDKGQKGEEGQKGFKGDKGEKGIKGDKGTKGDKGQKGEHGNLGAQGDKAGLRYDWSNSTGMSQPGDGTFRYNNGTLSAVTALAIDHETIEGTDVSDYIASWDDSNSAIKGYLTVKSNTNSDATHTIFEVTAVTDNNTWLQITVQNPVGNKPSISEECVINFSRAGQKGQAGGSGDKGEEGDKGIKGDKGEKGQKGQAGEDADKGQKGDKGNKGEEGENADKGVKGAPGENAEKGQPGEEPDKGQKGAPGEEPDKGVKGAPGEDADKGVKGAPGEDADKGIKGTPGEKGSTGDPTGNAGTVTIRTESDDAYHNILFVDSGNDNLAQVLKMDSQIGRLAWNPYWNNLLANSSQSYYLREWSTGSVGTAGYLLSSGGSSGWTWKDPATISTLKGDQGDEGDEGPPGPPGPTGSPYLSAFGSVTGMSPPYPNNGTPTGTLRNNYRVSSVTGAMSGNDTNDTYDGGMTVNMSPGTGSSAYTVVISGRYESWGNTYSNHPPNWGDVRDLVLLHAYSLTSSNFKLKGMGTTYSTDSAYPPHGRINYSEMHFSVFDTTSGTDQT